MQNFRISTAQVKPHQICTLIDFFLLKVYKISAKKVQRSYVSWYWGVVENLKILFFFFKYGKNLLNFDPSTKKSKKFAHIYISWHWRDKENWKFEEKSTCGLESERRNLEDFHQSAWKCKNCYFHGITLSKVKNV